MNYLEYQNPTDQQGTLFEPSNDLLAEKVTIASNAEPMSTFGSENYIKISQTYSGGSPEPT